MRSELFELDTALLTARTVVRRFRENDGGVLYDLFQANRNLLLDNFPKTDRALSTKEKAELYVRQSISDWLFHKDFTFGVWDVPKGELAFFVDKDHSGKGIMTETLHAVLQLAFSKMKFAKVYIRTATDNYGSQRVARKLGFRREGDHRADFRTPDGALVDTLVFGLMAQDF